MRLYMYLARRDKKGVRVITVLDGPATTPVRVTSLKSLQLPPVITDSVAQIIHENRMFWEPWIESSESYAELRKKLQKRGYTKLYVNNKPIYDGTSLLSPPKVDMSKHPQKRTMVRRKDS